MCHVIPSPKWERVRVRDEKTSSYVFIVSTPHPNLLPSRGEGNL